MSLLSKGLRSATDSLGLTDHKGKKKAREQAKEATDRQLGLQEDMWDYWMENMAPHQQETMERQSQLYEDATLDDADYEQALGLASSDVSKSFSKAREANNRALTRYGINPNSGRFVGRNDATTRDEAAADAAARNKTRMGLKNQEFNQRASALGLGVSTGNFASGMPGTSAGLASSAASNWTNAYTGLSQANMGAMGQFWGGAMEGAGSQMADGGEYKDFELAGEVRGPGTPVSDSVPVPAEGGRARLADGEVVIPTDTVASFGLRMFHENPEAAAHKLGVAILQEHIDATHVPAEHQRRFGISVEPRTFEATEEAPGQYGVRGYADGGETEDDEGVNWGKALAYGLANAVGGGGFMRGVRGAEAARAREQERQWQEEQRERKRQEQERQDRYREDMRKAAVTASSDPYTEGDVSDPEFGLSAAYGGEGQKMSYGLRTEKPFDSDAYATEAEKAMARHDPTAYLELLSGRRSKQSDRDWEREKLGIQHRNKLEQISAEGVRGGKAPADVQTARWLMEENPNLSRQDALLIAQTSMSDPTTSVVKLADSLMFDPKYQDMSPEERFAAAERMVTQVRQRQFGGKQQQQARGNRIPTPKPGTVLDGYRFNGGNPNDKSRWEAVK